MLELAEIARSFPPSLCVGLVGYWRMEEASWDGTPGEVIDSSGQGNHGQAINGANTIADGKLGRGGETDHISNQHIQFPISVMNVNEGTWSIWVNATWSAMAGLGRLFATANTGTNTAFRTQWGSNKLIWIYGNGSAKTSTSIRTMTDDVWIHVLFTWKYDGVNTTVSGYKNGVFQASSSLAENISFPDTDMYVGRWSTGYSSMKVDEFTIHNRVLNSEERAALYNSGAAALLSLSDSFALPLEVVDINPELEVVEA